MGEGRRFYIRIEIQEVLVGGGGGGGGIDSLIYLHKTLHTRVFPTEGIQDMEKISALIRNDFE